MYRLPDRLVAMPGLTFRDDYWNVEFIDGEAHGSYIRALLPVRLTGGYNVRFGVWIRVDPDDFSYADRVWDSPLYPSLALDGALANALPVWGLLDAPVRVEVRDERARPFVVRSSHYVLSRVLTGEFDHELVLPVLLG